jgi:hypothetical protein
MIHWLMEKLGLSHCPECHTLVDFAMDGLEDGQRGKVRKHLSECPPCMEQVRDFLQVNEGLGLTAPDQDCPEGFEQRVLQRLKQEGAAPQRFAPAPLALGGWPLFWLRLGPVFACLSLVMTFIAFAAVWHAGASRAAAPTNELAKMSEALLNDPHALHVALASTAAGQGGGELVLCPGMTHVYLSAQHLGACAKGHSYVLWVQPQGAAQAQRVAAFMVQAEGPQVQLLQMAQPLGAKGPVKFMLTEDDLEAPAPHSGEAMLSGSVSL